MKKRIDSEESRINNLKKLRELHELRDKVYTGRVDSFHWDLTDCIDFHRSEKIVQQEESIPMLNSEYIVKSDYNYTIGAYVAVRPEGKDDASPFWIGKIVGVKANNSGTVNQLELHWLQPETKGGVYDFLYNLSFLQHSKESKKQAWKDVVSVDSVLSTFNGLTARSRLPVSVQKQLRQDDGE